MNFRDYKWFKNPRGLHNNGPYSPLNTTRYTGPKMGWAKLVVGGTEQVDAAKRLIGQSCMPIIRIFRERMGAMPALDSWHDIYHQYFEVGCCWFEFYDEPNLESSWALGLAFTIDWNDTEWCVRPLMDNWLTWAERIIEMGGYPAFPAMAETTDPRPATIAWQEACLKYLRENQATRFIRVLTNGLWCATHPYLLNHFYQEPPGGPSYVARPYYQQIAIETGWHFEYPYDPLQQRDDPGRTIFGGTPRAPQGDPHGLIATGQAFQDLLKRLFDASPVPIVGTAGGIGPIPGPHDDPVQPDRRYPPFSRDSHGEATLAMWRWIANQGPPWLFGLTLSTEADYYDRQGAVPAIELMLTEAPLLKEVPNLDISIDIIVRERSRPSPTEPIAPPPDLYVASQPEPVLTGPDVETFLDEIAPSPSDEDDFASILFEESEIEMEMPSLDAIAPPAEVATPEPPLFEESEPEVEMPPFDAIAPPAEVATPEPPLFEEIEPEVEMPSLDAIAPPAEIATPEPPLFEEIEPEVEMPSLDAIAPSAEVATPEPPLFEEIEPEVEMPSLDAIAPPAEVAMPDLPWIEEPELEMPPFEAIAPSTELAEPEVESSTEEVAFEPILYEEPALEELEPVEPIDEEPDLEPIPFEIWGEDEISPELSPIEMALPELAWDYNGPAELASPPTETQPVAAKPAKKVQPQLLQDTSIIDELRSGPPPTKLDYHFVMVTSDVSPDWFFQAGYRYWCTFQPALLAQPDLMALLPAGKSIAVTMLATSATARETYNQIHAQLPDVYIDPMVFDSPEAMRAELDRRAAQQQRLG